MVQINYIITIIESIYSLGDQKTPKILGKQPTQTVANMAECTPATAVVLKGFNLLCNLTLTLIFIIKDHARI